VFQKLPSRRKPKIVLVNDTSVVPHAGCQLVSLAYREQFARVGLELAGSVPLGANWNDYRPLLESADLVVVNGEGSIHHGKRPDLLAIAKSYPSVLVNCVYQDNPPDENLRRFRYVAARESLSVEALARHGVTAEVVPDVCLSASALRSFPKPHATDELGCTDNVTDPTTGFPIKYAGVRADDYLNRLCSYRGLCIGRFHAAIMAASLEIPFSAWPSNTHKTEGLMRDMGIPHLFRASQSEARQCVPDSFPGSARHYVVRAREKIDEMFAKLATEVSPW